MSNEMSHEATELELFLVNDWNSYRHLQDCINNLERKVARGTYDSDRAPKIFKYPVETAAKEYAKGYGTPWHVMFPVAVRREVEQSLFSDYCDEYNPECIGGAIDQPWLDA